MVFGGTPRRKLEEAADPTFVCAEYETKKKCVNSTFDCQWSRSVGCSANRRELKGITGELRRKLQKAADPTTCPLYKKKRGCENNDCFWNKDLGKCNGD